MSRASKLNWDPGRNKWKVVYKNQKHRFDGGTGKSDRQAKKRADDAWKQLRAEIDHQTEQAKPHRREYEAAIAEWNSVLTWCIDHGEEATAAAARDKLKRLTEKLARPIPPPLTFYDRLESMYGWPIELLESITQSLQPSRELDAHSLTTVVPTQKQLNSMDGTSTRIAAEVWRDRLQSQEKRVQICGTDDTFLSNVQAFVAEKRAEAAAGQITAGRVVGIKAHLDILLSFIGNTTSVKKTNHVTVSAFRSHLLERIAANQLSDFYGRDVLATFRQFLRWLADNTDKLENLPKNLNSKSLAISVAQRKAKTLDLAQVKSLLEQAKDRARLYLLLGLNCAMTQQDISDLRQDEVDWSQGTIHRKRSKTSDCENVPEVTYRLWPATLKLLKQERSKDEEKVLLSRHGLPLKTEDINAANKAKKTDVVRLMIGRVSKKTGIVFTMKTLKKTSASLLRNNRHFSGLESLFLDHAPKTVAEKHYTAIPQELLDEAVAWLGKELGVDRLNLPAPVKGNTPNPTNGPKKRSKQKGKALSSG